jgi:transcriptional regulator with XRE-family HTH domain
MPHLVQMTKPEIESAKKKFGRNLQKIRKEKGLTLKQLSYNCSLGDGRISEIEQGQFDIRLSTIIELAKGLEVNPSKLLEY